MGLSPEALFGGWRGSGRTLICVPDLTRAVDVGRALQALLPRLEGPSEVLVGLGLHRPMTDAELAPLQAACPWPIRQHDPDRCVPLGGPLRLTSAPHAESLPPIPARVSEHLDGIDTLVQVGCVELHQYAGFSGGHKATVVGAGGRETLSALHSRAMVCDPRVQVGKVRDNPFREAIDTLGARLEARLAQPSLAMQWLHDGRWVAGPTQAAFSLAAELTRSWIAVPRRWDRVLLRVPRIKASSFYQASRAATYLALSPSPPLNPGAELILEAACPEGMGCGPGEQAFAALMGETPAPWGSLLSGPVPRGAGIQRAFMLARLAARYRLRVVGCERAQELREHGIEAQSAPWTPDAETLVVEHPFQRLPQVGS